MDEEVILLMDAQVARVQKASTGGIAVVVVAVVVVVVVVVVP